MLTVILAGGASRRMGRDKAQLPFRGSTFLQSLIDRYGAALGSVAVSVNEAGRFRFAGAIELPDRFPNMGPLNGLVSGFSLPGAEAEEIFLTAADLPLGDPALAGRLAALRAESGADACVLRRGVKGTEPLFAVYGRERCLPAALDMLERGERSFFRLFERVRVRYVPPEETPGFDLDRILTNVNTPEEYKKLEERNHV